ncbi:hypothetical protein AYL99_10475 [Fonsecaea erecta]|uniref:HhH-GPD domain-containing protein n=1 Tax=Fonsecaea erecta TaxID=1367422 RepID=A0A178Z723_9EURO|nr:hypothetical protein AYL99_10475 [Fonsecaea erecta]OAP55502.1 hypothetical protein AYL99_10475 [Fonsecaea erecta]
MRTSKISQETTRIFNALSPNARAGRTTRSSKRLASFALGYNPDVEVKEEDDELVGDEASAGVAAPLDIEDVLRTSSRSSRKRKLGSDSPFTSTVVSTTTEWTSPRKIKKEEERRRRRRRRRTTMMGRNQRHRLVDVQEQNRNCRHGGQRRHQGHAGKESNCAGGHHGLRRAVLACGFATRETLPHPDESDVVLPDKRYGDSGRDAAPTHRTSSSTTYPKRRSTAIDLTVGNMITCDPKHLDSLIGKVGFHNNKTKYIKQVATILKQEYNSDIPNTIEGLIRLPGVGPKMAYLCMSAAWGIDEGIGVDVHVHRITNLWGWHKTKTPEETRAWLEGWLPRDKWHEINRMLVGLGQTVCLPVGRRCGDCDLAGTGLCKAEIRGWKATERRVKKEKVGVDIEEGIEVLKKETEDSKKVEIKEMVEDSS